jgi:hypothetical protein
VTDDGAVDTLLGDAGQDWFFGFPIDLTIGRHPTERNG